MCERSRSDAEEGIAVPARIAELAIGKSLPEQREAAHSEAAPGDAVSGEEDAFLGHRMTNSFGHAVSLDNRQSLSMYWFVYCCSIR